MSTAAIVNVTGYAGVELARLLARHPAVQLIEVTGRSAAGQPLARVFPHLFDLDLEIHAEVETSPDVVFLALPHKSSAEAAPGLLARGIKVIDISADFRLRDAESYRAWYGVEHPCPELLDSAVYGLPELHREEVRGATLVANPGCYPTSAILALAPAIRQGLIDPADLIIDAKSGLSGAGRTLALGTHYAEVNESLSAYGLTGHRHLPEIAQELSLVAGASLQPIFVPHLVPMTRGILSTAYARLRQGRPGSPAIGTEAVQGLYRSFYADHPFTVVTPTAPHTKQVTGSNYCFVHPFVDARTNRLVVLSAIDNLVKGAAGQAIQNLNLMLGFPEQAGLDAYPLYP